MKTKKFLLATSGATVDGRNINPDWLRQAAKNYDPKTYGARLDIEHIKGISGQAPFRAYGDVLELSVVENHEVKIGDNTEKRTALFGVFDVTPEAKKLNEESQKVYPSIELSLDFADSGEAYLMGCALTDTPAAIGTERLQFNRQIPGTEQLKQGDIGGLLEFAEDSPTTDAAAQEVKGFFSKLTEMLSGTAPKPEEKPKPVETAAFDAAKFTAELGQTLEKAFAKTAEVTSATDAKITALTVKVDALAASIENTEAPNQPKRPVGTGASGQYSKTDC